jgi:hypothetical protein
MLERTPHFQNIGEWANQMVPSRKKVKNKKIMVVTMSRNRICTEPMR